MSYVGGATGATSDTSAETLKYFKETMYNSQNKTLQKIIDKVLKGEIERDEEILRYITTYNWEAFDRYIQNNHGVENFYRLFQQLFFLYNLLEVITRKQYQIALGIQQVRWMVDDANCNKAMSGYTVENATFFYWESIDKNEQNLIKKEIHDLIKYRLYNPAVGVDLNDHYNRTIWYKVKTHKNYNGSWKGFGSNADYFPITETINFTKLACIYCPVLLFGSLSDQSLLKYIILHKERPYAMHFPESRSNLCTIHFEMHMIVANWRHDFHHSKSGGCEQGFGSINFSCKTDVNENTVVEQINNADSRLSQCIYNKEKIQSEDIDDGTMLSRALNDTGKLWTSQQHDLERR